jgi:hypothetical protein
MRSWDTTAGWPRRPEGRNDERCTGAGRHAEGPVHPQLGRQAREVGRQRADLPRLGDLPRQGVTGGPGPAVRVADQRLVRPGHPAFRRRRPDMGAGRQPVQLRRRPRHAPVVRRHAASLGVRACLAPGAVAGRPGHGLRRGGGRGPVPVDGRRPAVAGTARAALPSLGAVLAAGRRGDVPAHDHPGSAPPRAHVHRHLGRGRVPVRRRRRNVAAGQPRPAVGRHPRPGGRGGPLRAPAGDAPRPAGRAVHAEALGRDAQRRLRRVLA